MGKYKNLKEMQESPEYKKLIDLVRQAEREGVVDIYPPLPPDNKESKQ